MNFARSLRYSPMHAPLIAQTHKLTLGERDTMISKKLGRWEGAQLKQHKTDVDATASLVKLTLDPLYKSNFVKFVPSISGGVAGGALG